MSIYNFLDQTVPESEKTIEWHKKHILGYISFSGSKEHSLKKKEIQKLYYAYSATLDPEEEEIVKRTITQRCGVDFGPPYEIYPLIEARIDKLVGDYRKRPLKRKLLVNNQDAVIKKLDDKLDMITESLLRKENKELTDSLGFEPETENPDIEIPEDIEEFFMKDYRTNSEETGEDILKQILVVRKEKEKYYEALRHYLISSEIFGFLDEKDGHPSIFIPHPLDCFYDYNPNERIQKDPQYFVFDKFMGINDIFNNFEVSERDKEKLKKTTIGEKNAQWYQSENGSIRPRVVSMLWKSRKRIRFKSFVNEKEKEEYKLLSEDYKEEKRDKLVYVDIEDVRHITMLGPDIVLSWGSLDQQMRTIGNEKKRFLPVVGLVDYGTLGTNKIRSLAKKLDYLQKFASEILYELRLNMRQVDGNAMVYDLANVPKQWLEHGPEAAMEKVNFFLKRDRIQIINSRDKRANPYASSVNVSQKGRMQDLMNMIALIEDMADRITGVKTNEQNPYQKATVAEIEYDSVSSRVEEYFGPFDTWTDIMNERLILKAKHVYKPNDVFSFFAGDTQMKFLQISPDFFYDDLGIYTADNRKDYEDKKLLNDIASRLFGNAQSPQLMLDLIRVIKSDNVSEAESIVEKGVKALEQIKQENDKMIQETEKQKSANELEKEKIKADEAEKNRQNNIEVAMIYANNKADETREKVTSSNLQKMAEIEKDLTIEANRSNKKENEN